MSFQRSFGKTTWCEQAPESVKVGANSCTFSIFSFAVSVRELQELWRASNSINNLCVGELLCMSRNLRVSHLFCYPSLGPGDRGRRQGQRAGCLKDSTQTRPKGLLGASETSGGCFLTSTTNPEAFVENEVTGKY